MVNGLLTIDYPNSSDKYKNGHFLLEEERKKEDKCEPFGKKKKGETICPVFPSIMKFPVRNNHGRR